MPKNKVSDPITDQEIAFARLILSGAMTDRRAAESVGLNPNSAAYTKAKPCVRAYMLEHRARREACRRRQPHRPKLDREQVLNRLWELAHLGPEMTRGSISGQVKALSIIVAMENFIPDRRAVAAEKKSAPARTVEVYESAWMRKQKATTIDPQSSPAPNQEEGSPACPGVPWACPEPAAGSTGEAPQDPGPDQSTFANRFTPAEALEPYVSPFPPVTSTKVAFSIRKNPFAHRPR